MRATQSTGKVVGSPRDSLIAALIYWELLEQGGLRGQEILVSDQDAWINHRRVASSWCTTFQGRTLQWLNADDHETQNKIRKPERAVGLDSGR